MKKNENKSCDTASLSENRFLSLKLLSSIIIQNIFCIFWPRCHVRVPLFLWKTVQLFLTHTVGVFFLHKQVSLSDLSYSHCMVILHKYCCTGFFVPFPWQVFTCIVNIQSKYSVTTVDAVLLKTSSVKTASCTVRKVWADFAACDWITII